MNILATSLLQNFRVFSTKDTTLGVFCVDEIPRSFMIEDEFRKEKVPGETRVPAGIYKLGIRKALTPLTKKYRNNFDWFEYHIEILNVPNFTGIYIHIGNDEGDTAGCNLPGFSAHIKRGDFSNSESTKAFKELYLQLYPLLKNGADMYYEIIDNDKRY